MFDIDMSDLKNYLNTITKCVNQHAKLLDDVSKELAVRPMKNEIGSLFSLASQSFPYEKCLEQMNYVGHVERSEKVIEGLKKHGVKGDLCYDLQDHKPVKNMWEGLDRFIKTVELTGDYCMQLEDYHTKSKKTFDRAFKEIKTKVEKEAFNDTIKELK